MDKELIIEGYMENSDINEIFSNRKVVKCNITDEEVLIYFNNDEYFRMYHSQSCCEQVYIEDINGDTNLEGAIFYELKQKDCNMPPIDEYDTSYTWTFYTIVTSKGYLDIRWYGSSNGYYSESVDLEIGYYEKENNEKDTNV